MTTLGDVASRISAIEASVSGAEVYDLFESDPDLFALAVVDGTEAPIGLIERNAFVLKMASTYGRALYAGRPVGKLMDERPLIAERRRQVSDFATDALNGHPSELLKGIVVVDRGRYFGVAPITAILKAITDQARTQACELHQLAGELRRAESEARSAGSLLKEALEAMNEGVAIFDDDDRFILWNQRYVEHHPESAAFIRAGAHFADVVAKGIDNGQYREAMGRERAWRDERLNRRATLKERRSEEQELPDGRFLRIEETRLKTGGVISVAVDVTDLRRREASFRFLFDSNPIPLAVVDEESLAFLAANAAAETQYGYESGAFLNLDVRDLLRPEEADRNLEALREASLGVDSHRIWSHRRRNGEPIEVRCFVRPLTYEGRKALLVAALDVTAQRKAEASLTLALRQAESANLAKGEFLANMSHEIRTPLNGVIGLASVLARSGLTPGQTDLVGVIESSARTLQVLLNDLLDFSKLESGQLKLSPEPTLLTSVAERSAALFAPAAEEKGLSFRLELSGAVDTPVDVDRVRLTQIITNLCSNAVKFTETGSVTLSVHAEPAGERLRTVISVVDTGIGVAPAARERLFERFSQADGSITRRFGGTGLGLAISQQLAAMMGGSISLESSEAEGSTFTIELRLPFAAAEGASDLAASETAGFVPREDEGRLRVLLVEDHPVNRQVVEVMIGPFVDLQTAENGELGVAAFDRERFDLILMDMQMPVMDGITATRLIREREGALRLSRTPIVMLTANVFAEHVERCLEAGADLHLAKPVTVESLLGAVDLALRAGGAQDSAACAA